MKTNKRQNKSFSGNCSALMPCKQGKGKGVTLKGRGNCSTLLGAPGTLWKASQCVSSSPYLGILGTSAAWLYNLLPTSMVAPPPPTIFAPVL